MHVQNYIKKYRKKYKYSQIDLANSTLISQNMISDYENYKSYPSIYNALLICNVFDCKLDDMFKLVGENI